MTTATGTSSSRIRRITVEIGAFDEFVQTPDGLFKLAKPVWERGVHIVEYHPQDQFATATRKFGERFRQEMMQWLNAGDEMCTADAIGIAIRRAKQEVAADIRDGTVPGTVGSFSELHDYVDANGYGGAFDWPLRPGSGQAEENDESDEPYVLDTCAFWNAVQDGVDAWIKAGRPPASLT